MMDLAKIGEALLRGKEGGLLKPETFNLWTRSAIGGQTEAKELFCSYGLGLQAIEVGTPGCDDTLFGVEPIWLGHPGEAYGLQSGLWLNVVTGQGFAYFTTANPPPPGGEDTGNFTPREKALMRRALEMVELAD